MKSIVLFIYVMLPLLIYAQGNDIKYSNRNGEVLEEIVSTDSIITIRKHEDSFMIHSVKEGTWRRVNKQSVLEVLDEPVVNSDAIFVIPNYPIQTVIFTKSIRIEKNIKTNKVATWLYITTDYDKSGWLYLGLDYDPYEDNSWLVLGTLNTINKTWNLRTFNKTVFVYPNENVYDKPDINCANIVFKTISSNVEERVNILLITEEEDIIDGETGYWINIQDSLKRTGWIFEKSTYANRGGPVFRTPVEIIRLQFYFP